MWLKQVKGVMLSNDPVAQVIKVSWVPPRQKHGLMKYRAASCALVLAFREAADSRGPAHSRELKRMRKRQRALQRPPRPSLAASVAGEVWEVE